MIDLSNLSVITSVKIDSSDRLANWRVLLRYFQSFFANWEIIVVEQGTKSHLQSECVAGVLHHFIRSDSAHYKTHNLNLAAAMSKRDLLMMLDVDVLLPPGALTTALEKLSGEANFVCPYNGVMIEVPKSNIGARKDLSWLSKPVFFDKSDVRQGVVLDNGGFYPLYGDDKHDSTGGALMFRRADFFAAGGWNPNVISYGFEDMEMHERVQKLGYKLEKLHSFNSYHLEHARHVDSYYNNFYRNNESEFQRITDMTTDELREYVDHGFRHLRFSPTSNVELENNASTFSLKVCDRDRKHLSNLSIVFAVRDLGLKYPDDLVSFCDWMEARFDDYEIIIVEIAMRKYRHLRNMKNIRYLWQSHEHSLKEAADLGLLSSDRPIVSTHCFDGPIAAHDVRHRLESVLSGADISDHFSPRKRSRHGQPVSK